MSRDEQEQTTREKENNEIREMGTLELEKKSGEQRMPRSCIGKHKGDKV